MLSSQLLSPTTASRLPLGRKHNNVLQRQSRAVSNTATASAAAVAAAAAISDVGSLVGGPNE